MLQCNTYLRLFVLALLASSVLAMYVFSSSPSVFAAGPRLDRKPVAPMQVVDKASPKLCVQINLTFCTSYNPLQSKEPALFKLTSGSTLQIQGADWVTATTSHMYLVPAKMVAVPSSCAGTSALATSAVLTVSVQIEGDTGFSAIMQLPVQLEAGNTYNVCASGIGPDQRALDTKKTVLLFQIKTLNNTVVSQSQKSGVQGDAAPASLLSTIALLLAVIALSIFTVIDRQAKKQAEKPM